MQKRCANEQRKWRPVASSGAFMRPRRRARCVQPSCRPFRASHGPCPVKIISDCLTKCDKTERRTYTPWEVSHGDEEEGVSAVEDTGERVVPGGESGDDAEGTTGADAASLRHTGGGLEVADAEQQKGEVEGEEEEEEGDGGAEGTHEHEEGEDEPALEENELAEACWRAQGRAHTMRKKPKAFVKPLGSAPVAVYASTIWNPPGVRVIPKEIQKPP